VSNSSPADHQNLLFDACNDPTKPPCSPANNPIASYSWSFGDGGSASGRSATHSYNSPGTFVATLTITDFVGRSASASQTIDVAGGDVPTASFTTSPANPAVAQTVNFNGAASKPATGRTIRTYDWDFGDGAQASTGGPTAAHAYSAAGTYTVTLVVTDDAGRTATATGTVTVASDSPTADFTFAQLPPTTTHTVQFNSAPSSAVTGRTIVSYNWDFGDGTLPSTLASPAHTYSGPASYNVTLTVTDSAGKTGRVTKSVPVL
jgi:PKD repeat protein